MALWWINRKGDTNRHKGYSATVHKDCVTMKPVSNFMFHTTAVILEGWIPSV